MRRVAHQSIHDHIEVMSDPKPAEADVAKIAGGENVHKGKGEEQQDACHSWKTEREKIITAMLQFPRSSSVKSSFAKSPNDH